MVKEWKETRQDGKGLEGKERKRWGILKILQVLEINDQNITQHEFESKSIEIGILNRWIEKRRI